MFEDIIAAAKGSAVPVHEKQSEVKELDNSGVRISVVGVGGAGCNAVNRIYTQGIKSARTIAINTDGKHLNMIGSDKKILAGKNITRGLGAGGDLTVARKCAEADRDMLRKEIGENELIFLCAGMGGGTGSGMSPVVAEVAKEQGAIVIAMVTYPFALERIRIKKAQAALTDLVKVCDTVVVIDNNRLASYAPNLPINKAFELADSITTRAVTGISDTIMFPSLMNVDYADVKSVMQDGGLSMIALGHGHGTNKVTDVVKDTLEHPLLDVNYEGAKGCLIHIEGGADLTLGDAIKAGERLTESFDNNASIKMGARINPNLSGAMSMTAIITGVKSPYILGSSKSNEDSGSSDVEYL
ncbi:cell division protein FtsZ [Candidatus Micrarchaeota archaeon]|nr:cell division protein FtsZ [Candidatus Micrarchaeota archaeon]